MRITDLKVVVVELSAPGRGLEITQTGDPRRLRYTHRSTPTAERSRELYLRVLREFSAGSHGVEVAEYRRHGLGISAAAAQLLREVLAALRAQRPYVAGDASLTRAC